MNITSLILFSVFLWWLGRSATDAGLYITENNTGKLTLPPTWVFILCGLPTNKNVPKGVMSSRGLGIQLSCILLALIFIVLKAINLNSGIFYIISLTICLISGLLFSTIAHRVWPYPKSGH